MKYEELIKKDQHIKKIEQKIKETDSFLFTEFFVLFGIIYFFLKYHCNFKKKISIFLSYLIPIIIFCFVIGLCTLIIISIPDDAFKIPIQEPPISHIGVVEDAIYKCSASCGLGACRQICYTKRVKLNDKWYNLYFSTTVDIGTKINIMCNKEKCWVDY